MVVKILSPHKLLKVYKKKQNRKTRQKHTQKTPEENKGGNEMKMKSN